MPRCSRSSRVVPAARCASREGINLVASALRTTAGRDQQGPHISEVSSKLASLNPSKYTKRIVTKESKEINVFFYFVYNETNGFDEDFKIEAES